jgi:hypothetical protein
LKSGCGADVKKQTPANKNQYFKADGWEKSVGFFYYEGGIYR